MKHSKRIATLLLTVCLLLTAVPAFAANAVNLPTNSLVPATGAQVTVTACYYNETAGARFVLAGTDWAKLGITDYTAVDLNTVLSGAYFSGTAKIKVGEEVKDVVLKDAPVLKMTKSSANAPIIWVSYENLNACQVDASGNAVTSGDSYVTFAKDSQAGQSGLSLPGTVCSKESPVSIGDFPEGTIFIPVSSMPKDLNPGWTQTGDDPASGYLYYRKVSSTANGPYQDFTSKVTGTYNVWALIKDLSDTTDRSAVINIAESAYTFRDQTNAPASLGFYWVPAKETTAVSLTQDKDFTAQLSNASTAHGRLAVVALVPSASNAAFTTEFTVTERLSADYQFTNSNLTAIMNLYLTAAQPAAAGNVTVTYGDSQMVTLTSVPAGFAKHHTEIGLAASSTDVYGQALNQPTVADALAYAAVADTTFATWLADRVDTTGALVKTAVTVGGNAALYADKTAIAAGAQIVLTDSVQTNFAPISLGNQANKSGNQIFQVFSGASSGSPEGATSKFCLNQTYVQKYFNAFADTVTADNGLKGCYLNGYVTLTGTGAPTVDASSKIYFNNVSILGYDGGAASAYTDKARIDLAINQIASISKKADSDVTVTVGDKTYYKPYALANADCAYYDMSNLYITNSTTKSGVTVVDLGDGKYSLTAEGMELCDIITVTYDGGKVTSTEIQKEVIVMFNAPVTVSAAENQKVYVWKSKALEGTDMVPLCAVIDGAN